LETGNCGTGVIIISSGDTTTDGICD